MSQAQALKIAVEKQRQASKRRNFALGCQQEDRDETAQRQAINLYVEAVNELAAWTAKATKRSDIRSPADIGQARYDERSCANLISALREHVGV